MIRPASTWPTTPRRGLTLIEMMVTVALVLMIMVIVVSIFAAATTAISGMQVYQDLDQNLRRFDTTIRQDLAGTTARMTPPLNPNQNLGYFEYCENAFADLQGEDTDDYLAFTVKAPEGHPFTGRAWVASPGALNPSIQPITITSQFAEVIYFLRDGNLYRRVLLIVPERQNSLTTIGPYNPTLFNGLSVSWQGMNDLSAHPTTFVGPLGPIPKLNSLGDLTNRENRFARPRFTNDYVNNGSGASGPDGIADDQNRNGVADFYPTLYPNVLASGLLNEGSPGPPSGRAGLASLDTLAFPYIFPGAYSKNDPTMPTAWRVHSAQTPFPFPQNLNHAPLELGDGLPVPSPALHQTWWGFPTWRETMSPMWQDPVKPVALGPVGQTAGLSWVSVTPLPFMTTAYIPGTSVPFRTSNQPFGDGAGSATFAQPIPAGAFPLWGMTWEDDLILTGVRSFDVKAYDPNPALGFAPGYYDLGYGDNVAVPPYLNNTPPIVQSSFGHEGRMPPLTSDFRFDPKWGTNVGEDSPSTLRMLRVWDTWSTAYSDAPDSPINPLEGMPNGVAPYNRAVYPSYPAPYPSALRSIQINIRVVDPRNERIRVLTIRQDFTDKL